MSNDFEKFGLLLPQLTGLAVEAASPYDLLREIVAISEEIFRPEGIQIQIAEIAKDGNAIIPSGQRFETSIGGPFIQVQVLGKEYKLLFLQERPIPPDMLQQWIKEFNDVIRYSLTFFVVRQAGILQSSRQDFVDSILGVAPSNPEVDVLALCKAWQTVTKADSVWLVLKNSYMDFQPWEIFAQYPTVEQAGPLAFPKNNLPEYSIVSRQVVRVEDITNWRASIAGETYSVCCRAELKRVEASCLDCIPLLKPIRSDKSPADSCPVAEGAIVAAYKAPGGGARHEDRSLMVMGQLTASSLLNSYQAEQRKILVTLNELAERYLTRVTRNLSKLRQEYLNVVIDLIKNSIHVEGVSIFYRDISGTSVECLATTGLCDANSKKISIDDLSDVVYPVGVGLTGRCFAEGKPIILTESRPEKHQPKYIEMPQDQPIRSMPTVFYPIPASPTTAAGVIRCALHRSRIIKTLVRRFDPMDIQTLDFIARQLAPALHSMDINIRREQTISITKHDIRAPLQMTRSTLPLLEGTNESNQTRNLALKDIGTAVEVALGLVERLDPDPAEVKDFDPKITLLEGHIVARLKAMLSHYALSTKQMRITFGSFANVPAVLVDRGLIERALSNLIMNAIKYGERGTEISIIPRAGPEGFFVHIINFGIGVAQEDVNHIFMANFRSKRTLSLALGSGLGLTIARAAMEKHGGKLTVTNLKDPTIFSMFFPRKLIVNQ